MSNLPEWHDFDDLAEAIAETQGEDREYADDCRYMNVPEGWAEPE